MTTTTIQLSSISYHAQQAGQDAHAAYWLESMTSDDASHLRTNILESIAKAAELLGYKLVKTEIQPVETAE